MDNPDRSILQSSLPGGVDTVAPDGADIRVLLSTGQASMAHGTLAVGQTSFAITHKTVLELWFVVGGSAEIWRRTEEDQSVVTVAAGDALTIPLGAHFQYRTVGDAPFEFIMTTIPAWSGADEAMAVPGTWDASGRAS